MSDFATFMESIKGLSKEASTHVEEGFDKQAAQTGILDDAGFLSVSGEALLKTAEAMEGGDADLQALFSGLGAGLAQLGQGLTAGLHKTASNDNAGALLDSIVIQDELSKYAQVLQKTASALEDEGLASIADGVTEIANELHDDLAAIAQQDPSVLEALQQHYSEQDAE